MSFSFFDLYIFVSTLSHTIIPHTIISHYIATYLPETRTRTQVGKHSHGPKEVEEEYFSAGTRTERKGSRH